MFDRIDILQITYVTFHRGIIKKIRVSNVVEKNIVSVAVDSINIIIAITKFYKSIGYLH